MTEQEGLAEKIRKSLADLNRDVNKIAHPHGRRASHDRLKFLAADNRVDYLLNELFRGDQEDE